ncbi:DUF1190 family protein [Arsenophonus endosymbiont of Aphis craccivora]|uniref:DUF1190 family protein n=1 Tax=Arsenophonus endosymbiont of Aphis craccivora TaxID=1231049 RepID=UPI0015DC0B28|nr:DUF1190 family protein [Arsenophonus endosymbiont of Aphis craccivora]QLK88692.1 DUF1190 family protein [Arsenophonus endosymbiont of Aphis craccivora]
MKRTKNINQGAFRKSWRVYRLAPVALAISTVFMLSACEQSDETVSLYTNAEDCAQKNPAQSEQCSLAYKNALQEAAKTAPKYATREDCVAEFGEEKCTQAPTQTTTTTQTASQAQAGLATENQASRQSGSFWMPLMAGYMMGRLMGGGTAAPAPAAQPLFSSSNPASPANGKFVDASGKNYGPAVTGGRTMAVPPSALAPKPATTTTITRGGFGESFAKQQTRMQRQSATTPSQRSMGG